jgi:hypothetical protein
MEERHAEWVFTESGMRQKQDSIHDHPIEGGAVD